MHQVLHNGGAPSVHLFGMQHTGMEAADKVSTKLAGAHCSSTSIGVLIGCQMLCLSALSKVAAMKLAPEHSVARQDPLPADEGSRIHPLSTALRRGLRDALASRLRCRCNHEQAGLCCNAAVSALSHLGIHSTAADA